MADEQDKLKQDLEYLLKRMDSSTDIDGNAIDEYTIRTNTIESVNKFLRKLLNKDSVEFLDKQIEADRTFSNNKKATPTYNVRTPVIRIWINGIPVFPFNNKTSEYTGIYFQGFDVTYPLSGVETSVQGNLKVYARDPAIILDAIEGVETNSGDKKVFDVNNTSGLPIITVQWGWKFAISESDECKEVLSPAINFVILYIDMSNPDSGGVEFNFTLQDIGDTILSFSRKSCSIKSDTPQQQIRFLIEGMLNFRLFTLDDLLNLDKSNGGNRLRLKDGKYTEDTRTFFVNDSLGQTKTNAHTYLTVSQRLAYLCKCRWTSIRNADIGKAINDSKIASVKISELNDQISELKTEIETLKKNNKITNEQESKLSDKQAELNKFYTTLALSCKLYWVDNMPAEYRTTSNEHYIKDENTKKETGAFFLLPDLSHVDGDETIPLCYGPGASSFPYLHGSAQNVFNTSSEGRSCTFGDVIAISCKYDNMVGLLQASLYENSLSLTDGQYISAKNGASPEEFINDKFTGIVSETTEKESKNIAETQETLRNQELNQIRKEARRGARTNFRCINAVSPTGIIVGDTHKSDTSYEADGITRPVNLGAVDKQYYNTAGVKDFTSMQLRSRINFFLKYPLSINMTVFGDPTLLRMGVGGFELLSYYPTEDGSHHRLNSFISGVYLPLKITHRLTLGDYVCEISGLKQNKIAKNGVLVSKIVEQNINDNKTDGSKANVVTDSLEKEAVNIQLSSEDFTTGFLAKSLRDLYNKNKI